MTQRTETILDRIVAHKREELAAAKAADAARRDPRTSLELRRQSGTSQQPSALPVSASSPK